MTELELYIDSYFGVAKEDLSKISSFFHLTTLKKGDYFLKSGRVCDKLSFHKSGFIRVYVPTKEKEITQWISSSGYFITDLAGIIFNQPSKYTIQALSDCELYSIDRKDDNNLGQLIPGWHEIIHQALAFSLEIAMVVAIGYWGFQQGGKSTLLKYTLMIALPIVVMVLWGIFAAPKSHYRLDIPLRLLFAGALFALTTLSLFKTGNGTQAFIFGSFAFISLLMSYLFKD